MQQIQLKFKAGETIFEEGEQGDAMYVIMDGRVRIVRRGGREPVVLATLEPGAFFGEMAVVDRTPRTASAVAFTDSTVLAIDGSRLEALLEQRPDLGARMIRTLVRRLKFTTNQVMDEKEKMALLFDEEIDIRPAPEG
ncbi:MAG TPA: cyclic nucleotide-binding domain-containing protein [Arenicellales bacterium]|nr:cyclic nucleotide-binding domain-containing protein [Arenicellales bacterium]